MVNDKRDLCSLVEVRTENYGKTIVCKCKVKRCIYTKRHDLFCPVMGNNVGTVWNRM